MSNIAGKAFAMNLITPITTTIAWVNKRVFFAALRASPRWADGPIGMFCGAAGRLFGIRAKKLGGLVTLSMIHYARWVIVMPGEWPHLGKKQPKEDLTYAYQLFCSNFNGSWTQYVDSFSTAIPEGLDTLWRKNVGWPTSVPQQPFHRYVEHNEVWTNHYYSAYPMAASNDVKAAMRLKKELLCFINNSEHLSAPAFKTKYDKLLNSLQGSVHGDVVNDKFLCLGMLGPTPIVSLANAAVNERQRIEEAETQNAK